MAVVILATREVPAHCICQITVRTAETCHGEGLVEPQECGLPKHLLVAKSLTHVGPNQEVVLQVTNIEPTPLKLYKGTRIGEFIPSQHICILDDLEASESAGPKQAETGSKSKFDLSQTDLSPEEKLQQVLSTLTDLFTTSTGSKN